jgi:hypothetical protein
MQRLPQDQRLVVLRLYGICLVSDPQIDVSFVYPSHGPVSVFEHPRSSLLQVSIQVSLLV